MALGRMLAPVAPHTPRCGATHHLHLVALAAGKVKEASARSCHQEVLRRCKAAWASAAATSNSSAVSSVSDSSPAATTDAPSTSDAAGCAVGVVEGAAGSVMPGANGYLAAAELALQLTLPGLATRLLELAAGVRG